MERSDPESEHRTELAAERISPRPLLIVHGQQNALHSIEEARSLFSHARESTQECGHQRHRQSDAGDPVFLLVPE